MKAIYYTLFWFVCAIAYYLIAKISPACELFVVILFGSQIMGCLLHILFNTDTPDELVKIWFTSILPVALYLIFYKKAVQYKEKKAIRYRNGIYREALMHLTEKYRKNENTSLCASINAVQGYIFCNRTLQYLSFTPNNFPEIFLFEPSIYYAVNIWFEPKRQGSLRRIEILKKCIELTK